MSGKIDRRQYGNKSIAIYEIMAAHFVNVFYNELYKEAIKLKALRGISITEGYKLTLTSFIKGLDNHKICRKAINDLNGYFNTVGYGAFINSRKFINAVIAEFIPDDYVDSLDINRKTIILRQIISSSLKSFIKKIVKTHLLNIIDDHKNSDNVNLMQDDLIDCFIYERESIFQKFISNNKQSKECDIVRSEITEKVFKELKNKLSENLELKKKIVSLKKICVKYMDREKKFKEVINILQNKIKEIKSETIVRTMENETKNDKFIKEPSISDDDLSKPDEMSKLKHKQSFSKSYNEFDTKTENSNEESEEESNFISGLIENKNIKEGSIGNILENKTPYDDFGNEQSDNDSSNEFDEMDDEPTF